MKIPEEESADELVLNLTPMIDVVFLLLVFFMVATTFLDPERELELELPEAESGEPVDLELEEIVINVKRDGSVVLEGRTLDQRGLVEALQRAAERDPTTPVTIRGDRQAHHEHVVQVMDACGVAGLIHLAVGTLQDS